MIPVKEYKIEKGPMDLSTNERRENVEGMSDEVQDLWGIFGDIDILEPPIISDHGKFIFKVNGKDVIISSRNNNEIDLDILLSEFVGVNKEHYLEILAKDIMEFFSMTISDTPEALAKRFLEICINGKVVISDKSVNGFDIIAWKKENGYLFIFTDKAID